MSEKRGCLARLHPLAWLLLLGACDALLGLLLLSPDAVTLMTFLTCGCALLPLLLLPTALLYAHPFALGWALRSLELLPRPLIWLTVLLGLGGIAVGPGVIDRISEARAIARVGAEEPMGTPPRSAPKKLTLILSKSYRLGSESESFACGELCATLLFGGEVDALSIRVPGKGRATYRRVDATPCPPWQGGPRPPGLDAHEMAGQCLVAELGVLLDGPWLAWSQTAIPDQPFAKGPRAMVREAEAGTVPGEPTWREVHTDSRRLHIPFWIGPRDSPNGYFGIGAARHHEHHDDIDLAYVLVERMGYRLQPTKAPTVDPWDTLRHHLAHDQITPEQLKAIELMLRQLREHEPDHALLDLLFTDPRLRPTVFDGLTSYALNRPTALEPHLEQLLAIAENRTLQYLERGTVTRLLARLPRSTLAPYADRVLALAVPLPGDERAEVCGPLLPSVGRLGVDPSQALAEGLASEHYAVVRDAAHGLCNADPHWAPAVLDDAVARWQADNRPPPNLARALVRHGRNDVVEARLPQLEPRLQERIERRLAETVDDPPDGCRF